jgi:serine/threonine protein kinase
MGVVYLADDTRLSRRVALKALSQAIGPDPTARERLRREARAAAALSHPGIATVYALEEIGDELYLAFEYVPGPTLRALLDNGPLPPRQVLEIALQLAKALATAHSQNIVHRDLKPENVVRTPSGVIKVLDFGIARVEGLTSTRLTGTGSIVGTPAYMAPEQAQGDDADFRSDLFAFGVLVYEMASGSNPFEARTVTATISRILAVDPPALSVACGVEDEGFDRVVANCLRKNREGRYRSTQDLVDDLEELQARIAAPRDRPSPRRDARPPESASTYRITSRYKRWWRAHQLALMTLYLGSATLSWQIKEWMHDPVSRWAFVAIGFAAMTGGTARGHLIFTDALNPLRLVEERRRTSRMILAVDLLIAVALLADAVLLVPGTPLKAVATISLAVGIALASLLMEPATTAAAFGNSPQDARRRSGAKRPASQRPKRSHTDRAGQ